MTFDYAIAVYVVMVLAYGLSTIPLMRQGWGGGRSTSGAGGKLIRFPRSRARHVEAARLMRAS